MREAVTVHIDASPDRIWELVSDVTKIGRYSPETFEAKWESAQNYQPLGRITSIEWNRTNILFQEDPTSGARVGFAASWMKFEKGGEPARFTFEFRKSGPNWEVDDIPSLFPPDKPARGRR